MFLAGMSSYLKEWENTVELEMCSLRHTDEPNSQSSSGSVDTTFAVDSSRGRRTYTANTKELRRKLWRRTLHLTRGACQDSAHSVGDGHKQASPTVASI